MEYKSTADPMIQTFTHNSQFERQVSRVLVERPTCNPTCNWSVMSLSFVKGFLHCFVLVGSRNGFKCD